MKTATEKLEILKTLLLRNLDKGQFVAAGLNRQEIRALCREQGWEEPEILHDPAEKAKPQRIRPPAVKTTPVQELLADEAPAPPSLVADRYRAEMLTAQSDLRLTLAQLTTSRQACTVAAERVLELEGDLQAALDQCREMERRLADALTANSELMRDTATATEPPQGGADVLRGHGSIVGFLGCIARDFSLDNEQQSHLARALIFTSQSLHRDACILDGGE